MFYRLIRCLFLVVARPMFALQVEGRERVPLDGPLVVVAAHRSWLDPPCVGAAFPRPVRFLIRDRVYHTAWARWFYRWMNSIPVTPGGRDSVPAIREALRALEAGSVVGVFPEGRIVTHGGMGEIHPGAAMLAVRAGASVVPVRIVGSARAWPHEHKLPRRAPVRVSIGRPIEPVSGRLREALPQMARKIEQAVRELYEETSDPRAEATSSGAAE